MSIMRIEEMKLSQERAPILEALSQYRENRIVSFDVPGHKQGKGNPELTEFLGRQCMSVDVNSMKPLDNLCHPVSVIKEAEELMADAFGAANAFFMVNGTSSAVQAMVMSVCKRGDKIIMPRNVHRSSINALIVCGAVPVYVNPGVNKQLGIPLGMSVESVKNAIAKHPDAKAIIVNKTEKEKYEKELAKKTRFISRFPIEPMLDSYASTAHNINGCGMYEYNSYPHKHWAIPYCGYGVNPDFDYLYPRKPKCKYFEYIAKVNGTSKPGTIQVVFPAEAQLFLGDYDIIVIAKVYNPGYEENSKTITMDYVDAFTLVDHTEDEDYVNHLDDIDISTYTDYQGDIYVSSGELVGNNINLNLTGGGVVPISVDPITAWYED